MNSLNILSARVVGPSLNPSEEVSKSDEKASTALARDSDNQPSFDKYAVASEKDDAQHGGYNLEKEDRGGKYEADDTDDEESPLIPSEKQAAIEPVASTWRSIPLKYADALLLSIKRVLATIAAPGIYLIDCFYDEKGNFSPLMPIRRIRPYVLLSSNKRRATPSAMESNELSSKKQTQKKSLRRKVLKALELERKDSSSTAAMSESDEDKDLSSSTEAGDGAIDYFEKPPRRISDSHEDSDSNRRSIRIKIYNEDGHKNRRSRRLGTRGSADLTQDSNLSRDDKASPAAAPSLPESLKSPTSPITTLKMTRYPRAPVPPRPLVPRRQPSYLFPKVPSPQIPPKTLILDLDETLIHSLAKGGRMSTGHMVEVKLNAPVGFGGGVALGPQHPILYYVHKRPHCDEFLRKVSKWYNLVAFTASVQEYADPVIDWLEQDRKYFSGRYYRQHCTFRGGNYIKDLSSVEPDLSKVMIVDNSPSSYIFHEDNAIPIEGWISDPTDNNLLHLIPLLEALQHVTDVRALLALRMGEASFALGDSVAGQGGIA